MTEVTIAGITGARKAAGESPVLCAEQSQLAKFGVEAAENYFFLTPRRLFKEWAGSQKIYSHSLEDRLGGGEESGL